MAGQERSRSNPPQRRGPAPPVPPAFGMKLFKKCKSATFQIDGATYTIGKYI